MLVYGGYSPVHAATAEVIELGECQKMLLTIVIHSLCFEQVTAAIKGVASGPESVSF